MKKFYITTTIPYVNAAPHLGHALEFVEADVLARYHKHFLKEDVYLLAGTDDNAIKNVQAAEKASIPVKEFVDKNAEAFKKLLAALNVETNNFIRTSQDPHKKSAQAFWNATKKEDIYKKKYSGLYCIGCEAFYSESELNENGECFEHPGRKLESVEEENYFFKLTNYQLKLLDLVEKGELKIIPEKSKNEVLNVIKKVEDFSISRPASRTKDWGVPVPGDESQTMYVWYDALVNYVSALGYPGDSDGLLKNYWMENENKVHLLGKGVSRFHAVYWPAMLWSVGLPLPDTELVHGYVTIGGRKISKTLGNVVDPFKLIETYGVDALRFWLLHEASMFEDSDFTEEKFKESYNAYLANGLGNFVARILSLGELQGEIQFKDLKLSSLIEEKINSTKATVSKKMQIYRVDEAVREIWNLIKFGDVYIDEKKPWEKEEIQNFQVVYELVVILDNIGSMLMPFLPGTAQKIAESINSKQNDTVLRIKKQPPLFPRIS